jgi:DNA-binding PadR family transcriptional regulator
VKKPPEGFADPGSLLPLTPAVFHMLLALAGGECHGYGIMQEVDRLTMGQLHLGPGTLYRSIQRMLLDGLIEETTAGPDSESDDERRRNYRLTGFGREVARAESRRLEILVENARRRKLLSDPPNTP